MDINCISTWLMATPVSCILTSASLHDSQAAIPLARITGERADCCYELMDAACDCDCIHLNAHWSGHVPIIDVNPRRDAALEAKAQRAAGHTDPARVRFRQRSSAEWVSSALKDSCGGRHVRVQRPVKVSAHLMFGILALTVEQL